ncbi:PRC-barrel domain containing protein OS=Streptomyces tendae OX=1932 GN=GUR47_06825 PE=4 SV=1 [Streptomyces tendae]
MRRGQPMAGFTVEAADGVIGHVDRQQDEPGMQHLVVDTGVWKFGRSVLMPGRRRHRHRRRGAEGAGRTDAGGDQEPLPVSPTDSETADPGYLSKVGDYYLSLRI